MSKAKAGLRGLNAADKLGRAKCIHGYMNGNPEFPDPSPSMVEFEEGIEELQLAISEALSGSRQGYTKRNIAEQQISEMITRLAGYVNSVCIGDRIKIESAGFFLTKTPERISTMAMPGNVRVRRGAIAQQLVLRWERVPGALMYLVEELVGGTLSDPVWHMVDIVSDHRLFVHGRDRNNSHTFRIQALGRRVKSPFAPAFYTSAA